MTNLKRSFSPGLHTLHTPYQNGHDYIYVHAHTYNFFFSFSLFFFLFFNFFLMFFFFFFLLFVNNLPRRRFINQQ